jgi:tetratricopeptide (TPR) repeat protein
MVMEKANQTGAAIEMYKKAIEADPQSWRAHKGLGRCYLEWNDPSAAETSFATTLPLVEPISKWEHMETSCAIINVKSERGQHQAAVEEALELYRQFPDSPEVLSLYVQCLFRLQDFSTIANLAETHIKSFDGFCSFHRVQQEVAIALRQTKRTEPILTCIPPGCIKKDRVAKMPWLAVWLAEFRYECAEDRSIAVGEFEHFLKPEFRAAVSTELQWSLSYPSYTAWSKLTAIYFEKAIEESQRGGNAEEWIAKLKGFVDTGVTLEGVPQPAMTLGYYLREIEKADESEWKPAFRIYISKILQKLSEQDYTELWYLTHALLLAVGNTTTPSHRS